MHLEDIIQKLNLKPLTHSHDYSAINVKNGYCSDLLSCVMTGAQPEGVWVTLIAHSNIVAVAALLDLAAIIITEGAQPDEETIQKANETGIILLSAAETNFHIVGQLWQMGLRAAKT